MRGTVVGQDITNYESKIAERVVRFQKSFCKAEYGQRQEQFHLELRKKTRLKIFTRNREFNVNSDPHLIEIVDLRQLQNQVREYIPQLSQNQYNALQELIGYAKIESDLNNLNMLLTNILLISNTDQPALQYMIDYGIIELIQQCCNCQAQNSIQMNILSIAALISTGSQNQVTQLYLSIFQNQVYPIMINSSGKILRKSLQIMANFAEFSEYAAQEMSQTNLLTEIYDLVVNREEQQNNVIPNAARWLTFIAMHYKNFSQDYHHKVAQLIEQFIVFRDDYTQSYVISALQYLTKDIQYAELVYNSDYFSIIVDSLAGCSSLLNKYSARVISNITYTDSIKLHQWVEKILYNSNNIITKDEALRYEYFVILSNILHDYNFYRNVIDNAPQILNNVKKGIQDTDERAAKRALKTVKMAILKMDFDDNFFIRNEEFFLCLNNSSIQNSRNQQIQMEIITIVQALLFRYEANQQFIQQQILDSQILDTLYKCDCVRENSQLASSIEEIYAVYFSEENDEENLLQMNNEVFVFS